MLHTKWAFPHFPPYHHCFKSQIIISAQPLPIKEEESLYYWTQSIFLWLDLRVVSKVRQLANYWFHSLLKTLFAWLRKENDALCTLTNGLTANDEPAFILDISVTATQTPSLAGLLEQRMHWWRELSRFFPVVAPNMKSTMCQNKREDPRGESVSLYLYLDVSILRWFI